MNTLVLNGLLALLFFLLSTALFFFVVTRGALLVRHLSLKEHAVSYVYPIYSNMRLIKLVDRQPITSALLLFQYHRLVATIVSDLRQLDLTNKKLLVTSCAFGNVIPRVVEAAASSGADQILIVDIVHNELINAQRKLAPFDSRVRYIEDNAAAMRQPDGLVAANVLFFLLHELPHPLKAQVLNEAGRVLARGGKLYIAEFHRPQISILRALSWVYFKVFEPYGLALWDTDDPVSYLESMGGWTCHRITYFFGNFQVIIATKQ